MKGILTSAYKNKFSHVSNECVDIQQIQNPRRPGIFYMRAYNSFYKYTKLLPFVFCGLNKGKAVLFTGLEWPRGFQEVKVPIFHDNSTGRW